MDRRADLQLLVEALALLTQPHARQLPLPLHRLPAAHAGPRWSQELRQCRAALPWLPGVCHPASAAAHAFAHDRADSPPPPPPPPLSLTPLLRVFAGGARPGVFICGELPASLSESPPTRCSHPPTPPRVRAPRPTRSRSASMRSRRSAAARSWASVSASRWRRSSSPLASSILQRWGAHSRGANDKCTDPRS